MEMPGRARFIVAAVALAVSVSIRARAEYTLRIPPPGMGREGAPAGGASRAGASEGDLDRWIRSGSIPENFIERYLPDGDSDGPLARLLRKADELTRFEGGDGVPYRQHAWAEPSDAENLLLGLDTSRAVWFAFTRAGLAYAEGDDYVTTVRMADPEGPLRGHFGACEGGMRTGDLLVYRDEERGAGHSVIVIDPERRIAWGSHGWDGSPRLDPELAADTGVEYQMIRFKPDWSSWDRAAMRKVRCWRHESFVAEGRGRAIRNRFVRSR